MVFFSKENAARRPLDELDEGHEQLSDEEDFSSPVPDPVHHEPPKKVPTSPEPSRKAPPEPVVIYLQSTYPKQFVAIKNK